MQMTTTFLKLLSTYINQLPTKIKAIHSLVWVGGLIVINIPGFDYTIGIFSGGNYSLLVPSIFGTILNMVLFYGVVVLVKASFKSDIQKFAKATGILFLSICVVEGLLDAISFLVIFEQFPEWIFSELLIGTLLLNGMFFLIPGLIYGIISDAYGEQEESEEQIVVKDGSREIFLKPSELLFVKSDGNYVVYHTTRGKFMIRESLRTLEDRLPEIFKRSHRSYIVNTSLIESKTYNSLSIADIEIPIGRTYSEDFKKL
jgi:hypothetical protein